MCYFRETIRFAIFAFGVIYLLSGAALLSIGAIYFVTFNDLSKAIPNSYHNLFLIPNLSLAAGCLIILLTIFGFIAATYNKQLLLWIYSTLLVAVFLFQLFAGIFTFVAIQDQNDLSKSVNNTVLEIFRSNENDLIVLIQSELHCCGTDGPNFWNTTVNQPFPDSCCSDENCNNTQQNGCQLAVFQFLLEAIKVVGVAVLAFSASEIVGAFLAIFMTQDIKYSQNSYRSVNENDSV